MKLKANAVLQCALLSILLCNQQLSGLLLLLLLYYQALTLRYGEPRDLEVLTQLAGSLTTALGTHWLGVNDLCGSGRLDSILRSIAAVGSSRAGGDGGRAAATAAGGKQKAEIGLQQLSKLQ